MEKLRTKNYAEIRVHEDGNNGYDGDRDFEAPEATWELVFAEKRVSTSDFESLEVLRAAKVDQGSPKTLPKRLRKGHTKLHGSGLGALGGP